MLRDLPDHFSSQVRRSALVFLVYSLCQTWPGLECIWGEITDGGFYFDFHLSHVPPPDFAERTERAFEATLKSRRQLRSVKRLTGNAADWFALKGQIDRAEIIQNNQNPVIDLAVIDDFLEPCSGDISSQMPHLELLLEGPSKVDREHQSQRKRVWRLQGQLFSSRQSKAQFAQKKRKLAARQLTHLELGRSLNFFELDAKGNSVLIWRRRGLAVRQRLIKWWTALQRCNEVELFTHLQIAPYSQQPETFGTAQSKPFALLKEKKDSESSRWSSWQLLDSQRQQGQLSGLFAQRYCWKDQTDVFCTKDQILLEFNAALKLIESTSHPFKFESAWLLTTPEKRDKIFLSISAHWKNTAFANLKHPVAEHKSEGSASVKAHLMIKDANGRWWSTGCASIHMDQKRQMPIKKELKHQNDWMVSYSLMGDLDRYLALILETHSGSLPTWLAMASLSVITCNDRHSIDIVRRNFAKEGIDVHFQRCTSSSEMQNSIERAFDRKETFVASMQNDQSGTFYMRLSKAKEEDMGQIDAASCASMADQSFYNALLSNSTQA